MEDSLSSVIGSLKELSKVPPKKVRKLRPLLVAAGDQSFFVHNGPVLKDLRELKEALETMSDAQYRYHVNAQRNDFASWVAAILHDPRCAAQLLATQSRLEASQAVAKTLQGYIL